MDSNNDFYDLNRFVWAQESIYPGVLAELRAGQKKSHWIWFIFPQVKGLGYSMTTRKYAIKSLEEASAYLEHAVLGSRLKQCTRLVSQIENRTVSEIFGEPDYMKFHSSMTLFSLVAEANSVFHAALKKYFESVPDMKTLEILKPRWISPALH